MIVQISGKIVDVNENSVVVQTGDLAYEVLVPSQVINEYKKIIPNDESQTHTFYTIQYVEGSSGHGNQLMRLVGFKRKIEKNFFQVYTSVEGVGYKTALKSLALPIQKIAVAIETSDAATLKKLPNIGGRTAEKMIATLKGRMQKFTLDHANQPLSAPVEQSLNSEVFQVLKQVGYTQAEAAELIEKVLRTKPEIKKTEDMIQEIFRLQNTSNL